MERVVITPQSTSEAAELDRLVAEFTERLSSTTKECVFYLSAPAVDENARVVETESPDTLEQFLQFLKSKLDPLVV